MSAAARAKSQSNAPGWMSQPATAPQDQLASTQTQLEAMADFYVSSDPLALDSRTLKDHQDRLSRMKLDLWEMRKQTNNIGDVLGHPVSPAGIETKLENAEQFLGQMRQYVGADKKPDKYFKAKRDLTRTLKDAVLEMKRQIR
jgi:hypothetical protein